MNKIRDRENQDTPSSENRIEQKLKENPAQFLKIQDSNSSTLSQSKAKTIFL